MMEKLELKHIAPYLPYGLKAKLSNEGIFNLDLEFPNENCNSVGLVKNFQFYKGNFSGEIEIKENYSFDFEEFDDIEIVLRPLSDLLIGDRINQFRNKHTIQHVINYALEIDELRYITQEEFNVLVTEHYDVFGLIEKGLAIDINTLEK